MATDFGNFPVVTFGDQQWNIYGYLQSCWKKPKWHRHRNNSNLPTLGVVPEEGVTVEDEAVVAEDEMDEGEVVAVVVPVAGGVVMEEEDGRVVLNR
jgi:hypothetical protein